MTDTEKLEYVKVFLDITDTSLDTELGVYLKSAEKEILNWLYSLTSIPEDVTTVPTKYEMVQINAVVFGYSIKGAEGEASHSENGISRTFKYADMIQYIRQNVTPYARIVAAEVTTE